MGERNAQKIHWILANQNNRPVGAGAMVGGKIVAVVSFYDDLDGDQNGKVDWDEWLVDCINPFNLDGRMVTKAALIVAKETAVERGDDEFHRAANKMLIHQAAGLATDGIFAVYFSRGVSMAGKGLAKLVTQNMVKEFALRKGMEKVAKEAFDAAVNPR